MSQPVPDQDERSKMKKLLNGNMDESIKARLPRADGTHPPALQQRIVPVSPPPEPEPSRARFKFMPAFWTIASIMSITVNIVLIVILLLTFQMLDRIRGLQRTAMDEASGLLGGLYTNFVKMDEANIRTSIHVEKEIPVQFSLNVSGPTNVTLSQDVTIGGALVTVSTGGFNITNARATIVLPQGTLLPINIENLVVPVDQKVLAVLDVPVDIPLDQTELHDPFVGLQQVVKPWYCLVEPKAALDGEQVCPPIRNPAATQPVTP